MLPSNHHENDETNSSRSLSINRSLQKSQDMISIERGSGLKTFKGLRQYKRMRRFKKNVQRVVRDLDDVYESMRDVVRRQDPDALLDLREGEQDESKDAKDEKQFTSLQEFEQNFYKEMKQEREQDVFNESDVQALQVCVKRLREMSEIHRELWCRVE